MAPTAWVYGQGTGSRFGGRRSYNMVAVSISEE